MKKQPIPSLAQAQFLARLWSGFMNGETNIGEYVTPTVTVCIKRGWLKDTGRTAIQMKGKEAKVYDLSIAGVDAIEDYLRETRYRRQVAA